MISRIFPFWGSKKEPSKNDPEVKASFEMHSFGPGKTNAKAVKEVGKILAKSFPNLKVNEFDSTVKGKLSRVERAIEDIGQYSSKNNLKEQVGVQIKFNPASSRKKGEQLAIAA